MSNLVISVEELKQQLNNIKLIDVRSNEERALFNIGGLHIPLQDIATRMSELNSNDRIVIYCHSGARSLMAAKMLIEAGFASVKSLAGGIMAWQAAEIKQTELV